MARSTCDRLDPHQVPEHPEWHQRVLRALVLKQHVEKCLSPTRVARREEEVGVQLLKLGIDRLPGTN
jgi:hypothetical protein